MSRPTEIDLIRKTPGVVGGDARVRNTRIAVWMLVECRRLGIPDEDLLDRYEVPLTSEDLEAAWDYYAEHTEEIERNIRENDED